MPKRAWRLAWIGAAGEVLNYYRLEDGTAKQFMTADHAFAFAERYKLPLISERKES